MIVKVFPDKEKVKSMLELIKMRERYVNSADFSNFPTGKAENYYEIIKELSSILLLLSGYKSVGENAHKEIVDFLFDKKRITEQERILIQDLRVRRNYSKYEGKQFNPIYLKNNEDKIKEIISKLKNLVSENL